MVRLSRRERERRPWLALGLSKRTANILLTAGVKEVSSLYEEDLIARLQEVRFCSQAALTEVIRLRHELRSDAAAEEGRNSGGRAGWSNARDNRMVSVGLRAPLRCRVPQPDRRSEGDGRAPR